MRVTAGATAASQGAIYLTNLTSPVVVPAGIVGTLAVIAGATLVVGFLTPVAGVLIGIGAIAIAVGWLPPATPNLFDAALPAVLVVIVALAVVLLGPGSFSVDARLFGRREIIIPRTVRSPRP